MAASSRVKFLLVNKSPSQPFFWSTYLIWILWVQVGSIKQPIKRDSVRSGLRPHSRTLAFDDRLDHCFIVLKRKCGFGVRRFCACDKVVHTGQLIILSVTMFLSFGIGVGVLALTLISQRVSPCRNVVRRTQYFYYQVPKIKHTYSVHT